MLFSHGVTYLLSEDCKELTCGVVVSLVSILCLSLSRSVAKLSLLPMLSASVVSSPAEACSVVFCGSGVGLHTKIVVVSHQLGHFLMLGEAPVEVLQLLFLAILSYLHEG